MVFYPKKSCFYGVFQKNLPEKPLKIAQASSSMGFLKGLLKTLVDVLKMDVECIFAMGIHGQVVSLGMLG